MQSASFPNREDMAEHSLIKTLHWNVALFGMTAKEWRDKNSDKNGNIRDYAILKQLVVLSNMESINALLIQQNLLQGERLIQLNKVAITQMKSLLENKETKRLK